MRLPLCALGFVLLCGALVRVQAQAPAGGGPPPVTKDAVFILATTPETLVDGVETEVEVTVAYDLTSQPEALIEVAANTVNPQSLSPVAAQRVSRGTGTVTVRGKLVPRFWTNNIVPRINALLVVAGEPLAPRKAVASDAKAVTVTLRPNPSETYAVNPNPSVVYQDGLRIKSIRPDRFVAGQAVDIEVVVSYELLSREVGELSLNFSRGMANSYTSVAKVQLNIGKGEVVLRGRVVPQATGNLSFAKVQVTLTEFPRRTRTAALATDGETVEVRVSSAP